ncbi:MAG TPA: hypothetical protein VGF64_00740 [Acidimicrobiales bacterium]|jgi:hypothetical protein
MAVIETHTFRLAAGADIGAFLDADRWVQTELMRQQPTFLRRTTAHGGNGDWLVVVIWSSRTDADTAQAQFDDEPANAAFMALVNRSTFTTSRYETLD